MKQDARKLPKDAQQAIRQKAILYWQKNKNMQATAEVFDVSYPAIRKWVSNYKKNGKESILSDKRGRPRGKGLGKFQETTIIRLLRTRQPEQLKLPFGLWTRENVGELLHTRYGIRRSVWQIGRYLKEWGFTPQRPAYKAYEQKSEEVKKWLDKIYPLLKQKAKRKRAMIFWGDETGVRSRDVRGRSFAPVGQTPVIRKIGKQFGVTMISAINNRGKLYFMLCHGGVNSDKFLLFLKRLIRSRKETIFLIIDNLPTHKTLFVKDWVEKNKKRIQLFYLPAYSPELNPDEYLNQDLKVNITGKVSMKNVDDLKKGVVRFMRKRKRSPKQVKKYFHHHKVQYAA